VFAMSATSSPRPSRILNFRQFGSRPAKGIIKGRLRSCTALWPQSPPLPSHEPTLHKSRSLYGQLGEFLIRQTLRNSSMSARVAFWPMLPETRFALKLLQPPALLGRFNEWAWDNREVFRKDPPVAHRGSDFAPCHLPPPFPVNHTGLG
jgi:hypothetical protein